MGLVVGLDGADVLPVAVDHQSLDGQPPLEGGGEHLLGEVDRLVLGDEVEDLRARARRCRC